MKDRVVRTAWLISPGLMRPASKADVGAPVAADLRLVAHPAQADAHELRRAPGRMERRARFLPTPGGPTKQRIGPPHLLLELAHRQALDDPLLDVLQAVVILVQDRLRLLEIQVVLVLIAKGRLIIQSRLSCAPWRSSAESGCIRSSFVDSGNRPPSCTFLGTLAFAGLDAQGLGPPRPDSFSPSPSSDWIGLHLLGAGKYSALPTVRSLRACGGDLLLHGQETSISRLSIVVGFFAGGSGGRDLQEGLASSILEIEVARTRSASRPGSSRLDAITSLGGDRLAERHAALERFLVLRTIASISRDGPGDGSTIPLDARLEVRPRGGRSLDPGRADPLDQHADAAGGKLEHPA